MIFPPYNLDTIFNCVKRWREEGGREEGGKKEEEVKEGGKEGEKEGREGGDREDV